jgi:hypothetical protein
VRRNGVWHESSLFVGRGRYGLVNGAVPTGEKSAVKRRGSAAAPGAHLRIKCGTMAISNQVSAAADRRLRGRAPSECHVDGRTQPRASPYSAACRRRGQPRTDTRGVRARAGPFVATDPASAPVPNYRAAHAPPPLPGPAAYAASRGAPNKSQAAPMAWPPAVQACIILISPRSQARASSIARCGRSSPGCACSKKVPHVLRATHHRHTTPCTKCSSHQNPDHMTINRQL